MSARLLKRLARLVERTRVVCSRVVGAPDYEAYLAHFATSHPGQVPLSEDAFVRERLDARFSRPGARCC
jgi:uncharacterized short protein YbdD (DUF466 family)